MPKQVKLYWWSEIQIQRKEFENYGDLIGPYLVAKITGVTPQWVRASRPGLLNSFSKVYATVGSILSHTGKRTIVWGSGIISKKDCVNAQKILAVRGPLTRKRLEELKINCPAIYGDPALLLPRYFLPNVKKSYSLGIVPHIVDYERVKELLKDKPFIKVINFNSNNVEKTTTEILKCDSIFSSSLHGIIVAHSYGIPAVQVQFSDKIVGDGVKYYDYFLSVGLVPYKALAISLENTLDQLLEIHKDHEERIPDPILINNLQDGLMAVCPFKIADNE